MLGSFSYALDGYVRLEGVEQRIAAWKAEVEKLRSIAKYVRLFVSRWRVHIKHRELTICLSCDLLVAI